jgi:hypothetical protein
MVRDKEYETATVLNGLPPMSNPVTVAETAGQTDQRRHVGGVVVTLSAIAGAIVIWIVSATMVVPGLYRAGVIGSGPDRGGMRTETMQLSCLSPQQAADIINPYIRSARSKFFVPTSGISAITVQGTPGELERARNLIHKFERDPGAACRADATRFQNTIESVDRAFEEANRARNATTSRGPPSGDGPGLLGPSANASLLPEKATTPPKKK